MLFNYFFHIKRGGKTQIINISLNEIAQYAEKKLNQHQFKKGYRDGVIIIEINEETFCQNFICPIIPDCLSASLSVEDKPETHTIISFTRVIILVKWYQMLKIL